MRKISINFWQRLFLFPRRGLLGLIWIYQKTLSPDHGFIKRFFPAGCCRFYPTCSEYATVIIKKKGLVKGIPRVIARILRCNPWSSGGVDLP